MSEIRREIKTVDPKDPKIVPSTPVEEPLKEKIENPESEETEAIDDPVIDGSPSIEAIKQEVEDMLKEAREEAQAIKVKAEEKGYDTGYIEGQKAFHMVIDNKLKELQEKEVALEEEKEAFIKDLEPKVAAIIQELLINMVGAYESDPKLILYLVRLAFEETHMYGSFVIKVSDEDFDYLVEHKEELTRDLSSKVEVEILKDTNMRPNQCFVETQMGNIDCSLDLRLKSLSRELKLIGESLKPVKPIRGEEDGTESV